MANRPARFLPVAHLLIALTTTACADPSRADCQTTYEHLLAVAHRNNDQIVMETFVATCLDAYDPKRLACLREAATPGAALACKPHKMRPD